MAKSIFRKVSLERLSSPEQLDQLIQVTTPRGWLALSALGGLLVCAIAWGILGSIPTKVRGQGILMQTGGVFDILAETAGSIQDVYFAPGDAVQKGQIVARIAQPEYLEKINNARASLQDLTDRFELVSQFGMEEGRLESQSMLQQRASLIHSISVLENQVEWLKERIKNQEKLLEQGLITTLDLRNTEQNLNNTQREIQNSQNQLKETQIRQLQLNRQKERELSSLQQQINETQRNYNTLLSSYEEFFKVVSPYTGRILEVNVDKGTLVSRGSPLVRLERMGVETMSLEAVMYFPAVEGKKISLGMTAQVAPSTVKQEEFGFLLGMITFVSEFPITSQGMMSTLQNEELVRGFIQQGGAPIEVRASLIPDPRTPSGYKWSSSVGPPVDIQTGTMCFSTVTVDKKRPISLVIPLIKRHVLGIGQADVKPKG